MIKVSVVVPVYNTSKYLRRCLDSLVNQSLKEIEILVINDCSTDNSKNILDEYEKKYQNIKVFHNKTNKGIGYNRNFGIKKASGEFIGFIDSDDYPELTWAEKLYNAAKENDTVIYFTISSKASGQNHSAQMVVEDIKEENPDFDIRIIDTLNFSAYIAYVAIETAKRLENGEEVEPAIEKSLEDMNKWKAYLLVDDMKYLEKGGRINKTTAVFGSLLDIKPILTIKDGLVEFEDKMRGKKKVYDKLLAKMEECPEYDADANRFMIVHSDVEAGEELKQKIEENYGEGTVEMFLEFGPIVGTHVGRKSVAVLFRTK